MSRSRSGFTLVELLMVIVVIAILSSLLLVGGMSVLGASREAQAKSIVHRAARVMNDRISDVRTRTQEDYPYNEWIAARDHLKKIAGSDAVMGTILQGIIDRVSTGAPKQLGREADLLSRIEQERLFFPQTWTEAEWSLRSLGENITWTINPETENSEVLYWMLTSRSGIGTKELGDIESLPESAHKDSDGNGKHELVDAWGNQIRFYRWPVRVNDNPLVAKLLFSQVEAVDPNNPLNLMSGFIIEPDYYAPQLYHSPIIISPGPDGIHGIGNPSDKMSGGYWGKVVNEDAFYDDIFVK